MPHRTALASAVFSNLIEGFLFFLTAGTASFRYVATLIDDSTWDKVKGTEGALFCVSVGIVAIWFSRGQSEKKADKRHDEMMAIYKESSAQLAGLTAEAIKSNFTVAAETAHLKDAHVKLVTLLEKSPCVALAMGYQFPSDRFALRQDIVHPDDLAAALDHSQPEAT